MDKSKLPKNDVKFFDKDSMSVKCTLYGCYKKFEQKTRMFEEFTEYYHECSECNQVVRVGSDRVKNSALNAYKYEQSEYNRWVRNNK